MKIKFIIFCTLALTIHSILYPRILAHRAIKCPACNTINRFQSSLEFNHNPFRGNTRIHYFSEDYTQNHIIFTCRKCLLSAFYWDFKAIPIFKAMKAGKKITAEFGDSVVFSNYQSLHFLKRLQMAEITYEQMEKDDNFWCQFYRIAAWHHEQNEEIMTAYNYRKKALKRVKKILRLSTSQGIQKELLMISGILHFHIGELKKSLVDFLAAGKFPFYQTGKSRKESMKKERKLDRMIREYIINIRSHLK